MTLVIFDADGTLTPQRPSNDAPAVRILLPGVKEKLAQLREQGCVFAVASNQSSERDWREMTDYFDWLSHEMGGAFIRHETDNSTESKKKPSPDMLLDAINHYHAVACNSVMVGDQEKDQLAALAAGCNFAWASEFFKGV